MDVHHLVTMANDIAHFFESELGPEQAHGGIRIHIARYWDPRMRRAIIRHVNGGGGGLNASALQAIRALPPVEHIAGLEAG
jgi:formate dehydrogenase subunit delta